MATKDDFVAEYAKSAKSRCKKCTQTIDKDTVRIGVLTPSDRFDGDIRVNYHVKCFMALFGSRVKSSADVKGIESLRWKDQQALKKKLGDEVDDAAAAAEDDDEEEEEEVTVEIAKSGRSTCKKCQEKIANKDLRVGKMDEAYMAWWHASCFTMPSCISKATDITGYSSLSAANKKIIADLVAEKKKETKEKEKEKEKEKPNNGKSEDKAKEEKEKAERLWKEIDKLKKKYSAAELKRMMRENDQSDKGSLDTLAPKCADGILNGAIPRCPNCKKGHLSYENDKYHCHGYISSWSKCLSVFDTIERTKWKIPNWDEEEEVREQEEEKEEKRSKSPKKRKIEQTLPLESEVVCFVGVVPDKDTLVELVEKMGGTVVDNVTKKVTKVITTKAEMNKERKQTKLQTAEKYGITIEYPENLTELNDQFENTKKQKVDGEEEEEEEEDRHEYIIIPKTKQVQPAPDKAFDIAEGCYVVGDEDNGFYNAVLSMSDLHAGSRGINSFYAMQLLKNPTKATWYVFRKWGRVGSEGNNTCYKYKTLKGATQAFEDLYAEKTGNEWQNRFRFRKLPGRFFPVVIDYGGDDDATVVALDISSKTRLHPKVAKLMSLIFDLKMFEQQMKSMDLDIKEMPLGKLGTFQINSGFDVLKEIKHELKKPSPNPITLKDLTNKFYTTIPHSFEGPPPIIDNQKLLQDKFEHLDVLLNMEVATSILKQKQENQSDPFFDKYQLLKNDIEPLDQNHPHWEIINKYMKNTSESYKGTITEIFTLNRHGEGDRFSNFNHLDTRKLLWHGTNIAVYAAILQGGMKIMPHSGGRVGKGLYFADMIGKSACYAGRTENNESLFLLAEVSLGKIHTLDKDDPSIRKAPNGFDSILATGRQEPDSVHDHIDHTLSISSHKVAIPQGKIIKTPHKASRFLHNEFLVYDEGQVQLKYLVKVKFE